MAAGRWWHSTQEVETGRSLFKASHNKQIYRQTGRSINESLLYIKDEGESLECNTKTDRQYDPALKSLQTAERAVTIDGDRHMP